MDDDESFIQAGELPPLSMAAFQLHTFAITESFQRGTPGFVSDEYLESITAETTVGAAELEMAGLWTRRDSGYFVNDDQTISMLIEFNERRHRSAAECLSRGHHIPRGGGAWVVCETCHAPLQRPDGKPVAGQNGEPPERPSRRDDLGLD